MEDRAEDFESKIAMWLQNKGCFELIETEAPSREEENKFLTTTFIGVLLVVLPLISLLYSPML